MEQIAFRRRGIGASEIAAVVGLNKWSRPIDVWRQKTGQAEGRTSTPATERGDFLEPALRDWYAYRFGREVALSDTLQHPEHPLALATPDGISTAPSGEGEPLLLEIKSPGQHTQRDWGDDGTDAIPMYYLPQVTWAMAVTRLQQAHVVALVHGELRCYHVPYDAELFAELLARGTEFWDRHVVRNVAPLPEGSPQYAAYLANKFKRASEQSEVVKSFAVTKIMERLQKAEEREKLAAYQAEKARAELKAIMGDAACAESEFGRVTWKNNRDTSKTDWRAVATALKASDEVIAQNTKTTPGPRVFRANWAATGEVE